MNRFRSVVTAVIGTALEYYDYTLYAHFVVILSPLFFPSDNLFITRLLGMFSFTMGFVMRPAGAIVFGHLGDRWGRRRVLATSIILMSVPTLVIGILPTYAQIGILAPIGLMLCRLVQSFSVGGESIGANIFLLEHAQKKYICTYNSLLNVGIAFGGIMATTLGIICSTYLDPGWGWRIPFIVGTSFGWIGFYLRLRTDETPDFIRSQKLRKSPNWPLLEVMRNNSLGVLYTICICAGVMTPFQILYVSMPDFLHNILHVSQTRVLMHSVLIISLTVVLFPSMGLLADKWGAKKIMNYSLIAMIVFTYPLFLLIEAQASALTVLFVQVVVTVFGAGVAAPCGVIVARMFPTQARYSGFAFGWSIGALIFAGTEPFITVLLANLIGYTNASALFLTFSAVLGLIGIKFAKNIAVIGEQKDQIQEPDNIPQKLAPA